MPSWDKSTHSLQGWYMAHVLKQSYDFRSASGITLRNMDNIGRHQTYKVSPLIIEMFFNNHIGTN